MRKPHPIEAAADMMDRLATALGQAIGYEVTVDMSDRLSPRLFKRKIPKNTKPLEELYLSNPIIRASVDEAIAQGHLTWKGLGMTKPQAPEEPAP